MLGARARNSPRKILIVDDHPVNLELLAAVLESEKYEVVRAEDGIAALDALKREEADAIISDILMPRMDGYRLCYEIRHSKDWRHLPFIFYTASYISSADEKLALDLGADAFLRKPASSEEIAAALKRVTGTRPKSRPKAVGPTREAEVMKEYSELLVSKLEEKNQELTRSLAERQRSEEVLRLFRTLVDRSTDAFEVIDPDTGHFLDVNERNCIDLGYTRDELLQLTVFDVSPGVKREDWPQIMRQTRALGGRSVEAVHRRKDGSTFPVEVNARWVHLERDYVVSIVRDISERKQAEARAARDQARFRFIFGSVPVGIAWMIPDDASSRLVNPAFSRITGVPIEQAADLEKFRLATHPADREKQARLHERLRRGEIDRYTLEKRYTHPGGAVVWAELTVRYFHDPSSGEIQEISTLVDLTEHKEAETALRRSEERLQQFIRHCPLNVAMFDREMRYIAVSESWMASYGQGRDTIIGLCHYDVLSDIPARWRAVHDRCLTGAVEKQEADPYDRAGLGRRLIKWEVRPWRDRHGEIGGIMLMSEDVTERKQAETEIREQLAELQRWHEAMLGREERVLELKREVNDLLGRTNQPPRYADPTRP